MSENRACRQDKQPWITVGGDTGWVPALSELAKEKAVGRRGQEAKQWIVTQPLDGTVQERK